jgi:hypothetical protein
VLTCEQARSICLNEYANRTWGDSPDSLGQGGGGSFVLNQAVAGNAATGTPLVPSTPSLTTAPPPHPMAMPTPEAAGSILHPHSSVEPTPALALSINHLYLGSGGRQTGNPGHEILPQGGAWCIPARTMELPTLHKGWDLAQG